jgi:MurNAc alpha-1-phosphate uridylyltransferase
MKAMLLAAGRGERMGELTADRPKALLSLGTETLVERQLRLLRRAGVRDVVINLSYHGALIREMLGDGRRYATQITYSEEGEPPLETAGGIVRALPLLGNEPFIVVNADIVTDFDYARLTRIIAGDLGKLLGILVLVPSPAHHRAGDFGIDARGLASADGERLTFSGISLLHPDLFAGHMAVRAPLRPILDAAIAGRRLGALRYDGVWIDVGTPGRLEAARNLPAEV